MKNINVNKNNQKSCEVEEKVINEDAVVDISVDEKIDKLFNTNGYVFSKNVEIVTNDKVYNTKIAGKVNNHIITLDNDIIKISDIKDIKY